MKVLVDTSVWSLALRRPSGTTVTAEQQATVQALRDLVLDGRAVLIGALRQELLSGIKTLTQFDTLKARLMAFDDIALTLQDYEVAAQSFNTCRANGVQGSNTDFLICAVAINHRLPVFTVDRDFELYQRWLDFGVYRG